MHIVVLKQVEVREDTSEKRQNWVLIAFLNAKLSLSILFIIRFRKPKYEAPVLL